MRRRVSIALGLLFTVVLFGATLSAARRVCDYCKQPIRKGTWVENDGKKYHSRHFLCDYCSEPIGSKRFYEHEGGKYDSACFAEHIVIRCNHCSEPILSSYVENDSATYHTTCFYDFVVERCMVCRDALTEKYFSDPFGNQVCADDYDKMLQCHSCARFIKDGPGSGGQRYPDGRMMCTSCRKTAITDLDEAGAIMTDVVEELRREGIDITPEIMLRMVTLDELKQVSDIFTPDQMGITIFETRSLGGDLWSRSDYKICILFGLPAYHFRVIVAHELMHVWLFKNGKADEIEPMLCEGSCNFASYIILSRDMSEKGRLLLERFLNDDDPVYGEGFRKVKTYVDRVGIQHWLNYLTKQTQPPW